MIVRPMIHPWVLQFIYWVKISTFKREPRTWDGVEGIRAYHIQEESALVSETFVISYTCRYVCSMFVFLDHGVKLNKLYFLLVTASWRNTVLEY